MTSTREQAEQLLADRQAARERRDYASADELRAQIDELGFLVVDTASGPQLAAKPEYEVTDPAAGFPAYAAGARAAVTVVVDGWLSDAREFISALLEHEPDDIQVLVVDSSGDHPTGKALEELRAAESRLALVHVPMSAGWADIHAAAASACSAEAYAVADMSTIVSGAAVSSCVEALLADSSVAATGWRGANVNQADQWRSVNAVESGPCDVLMSYLMVLRTADARQVPPHPKARFYRNADIEWCLRIREHFWQQHGQPPRMLALGDVLPASQTRHHGYHDSDEQMRDRESRKTYNRILASFRGRAELLGH